MARCEDSVLCGAPMVSAITPAVIPTNHWAPPVRTFSEKSMCESANIGCAAMVSAIWTTTKSSAS